MVNPGVRIYPFKTVEAGAVVNSSIVWESRAARTLFGRRGIRGLANVDVTPEIAVRVAAALGTALKKGATGPEFKEREPVATAKGRPPRSRPAPTHRERSRRDRPRRG